MVSVTGFKSSSVRRDVPGNVALILSKVGHCCHVLEKLPHQECHRLATPLPSTILSLAPKRTDEVIHLSRIVNNILGYNTETIINF